MEKFRNWPLINEIVAMYFDEKDGWTHLSEWDAKYLVELECLANAELQRRADAALGVSQHVPRSWSIH